MKNIEVTGLTIYELNRLGVNKWTCLVQPGFDDNGVRTSEEELTSIAKKLSLVDELYKNLSTMTELVKLTNGNSYDDINQAVEAATNVIRQYNENYG